MGNDITGYTFYHSPLYFNPRSHVGNDSQSDDPASFPVLFQSTFPRGERLFDERLFCSYIDFNPRSHVGNDSKVEGERDDWKISIHVPTWGTTNNWANEYTAEAISIHVPTWGTTWVQEHGAEFVTFQSTFPRGERHNPHPFKSQCLKISIHVPTWGTTTIQLIDYQDIAISIHVPTWGTTDGIRCTSGIRQNFNPRSHVGNDDDLRQIMQLPQDFNPRSHVGNDKW